MNIRLLRLRNEEEWIRNYPILWKWANAAAGRFLFRNKYSEEERESLAALVIFQFQKALCGRRIRRCTRDEDVERWIWGRTNWRAIDFREGRERERELFQEEPRDLPFNEQDIGGGVREAERADLVANPPPISDEARLDEIVAWADLAKDEEDAYREVWVKRKTVA